MSQPKILHIAAVADAGPEADEAYAILTNASGVLHGAGIDHNFGVSNYEAGDEPSVWLDKETGTVITRVPQNAEGYYGITVAIGLFFDEDNNKGPAIKSYTGISEEWEVLA